MSFGVLNLCHYVAYAPGLLFSILTATVASVYESCVVKAIIMIASDHWIDIRRSGLFSSVELRVEI